MQNRQMRRWNVRGALAIVVALPLSSCISAGPQSGPPAAITHGPLDGHYTGSDAGYLITGVTAQRGTTYSQYEIKFRKRDRSDSSELWWGQGNQFDRRSDDISDEMHHGILDIRPLPPGDYEVYAFSMSNIGNNYVASTFFGSRQEFSLRFTIRSGRATYLGDFMAAGTYGKNFFGMTVPDGAHYIVTDHFDRDVTRAKVLTPALGPADDGYVDPATVGSPLLRKELAQSP